MTQIDLEIKTMLRTVLRKFLQDKPIDWEQRRYEIAREVFANSFHGNLTPEKAVERADRLIKALKEKIDDEKKK